MSISSKNLYLNTRLQLIYKVQLSWSVKTLQVFSFESLKVKANQEIQIIVLLHFGESFISLKNANLMLALEKKSDICDSSSVENLNSNHPVEIF